MIVPETPSPARAGSRQQVALTCYLGVMLAMARSMRAVCSRAGLIYGDRLMRLPRRLGFEATPEALEESRDVLEADLAVYTEATTAWLDAGSSLAREIVAIVQGLDRGGRESETLHRAMLEDLAEQMAVSAEVDAPADLRASLKRYALGLRSYLQHQRVESRASLKDLESRGGQLADWLARADPAHSTDPSSGLPNRAETERQLEACWHAGKPVSVLLFEWNAADPAATPGAAQAIAMRAGANHSMGPVHAEVQIRGWSAFVVDRGVDGGTWWQGPGSQAWDKLGRTEQRELANGSHVSCGGRVLTYLSAWPA